MLRGALPWLPPILALALAAPVAAARQAQEAVAEALARRVELLRVAGELEIAGARIRFHPTLAGVYDARLYAPLWDGRTGTELVGALRALRDDGLEPSHYHVDAIAALEREPPSPEVAADLDLLRTDAFVRAAHDLRFGKVDRERHEAGRDLSRPVVGDDPVQAILSLVASGSPREALASLRPDHFIYRGLVQELARLRTLEARGGWPTVPSGPALRLGDVDPRVPLLRERLVLSGDLDPEDAGEGDRFDEALDAAVRRFQHRHALNEDGVVGRATVAEMNVPVAARIDQVRINLERARWFTHDLPASFVAANIAGARVYVVRDGDVVFETRAVVGTTYRATPVFTDVMRYIELNPTWTVPPGIVGDILANIRRDPDYLRRMDMRVLDRSGRPVDPSTIDFSQYTARSFPYIFRQEPGPLNALGRIKFMFPNQYNVYLHDTPSRELFAREDRNFSSGCIRVEDPITLAELVLDDPRWTRETLEAAIATGRTRTIPLEVPLPVLILYWTASADLHGEMHYYRDAYGRDAPLLRALDRAE